MGWSNPPIPWSELERRLSDGRPGNHPPAGDGGDAPAWSHKRKPYRPPAGPGVRAPGSGAPAPPDSVAAPGHPAPTGQGRPAPTGQGRPAPTGQGRSRWRRRPLHVPYAELHCHSNFSFLDGASHPEELAEEAARLGLEALALTDHDGMYGVVRFAEAAGVLGLPTVFGAELTLGRTRPQGGVADPQGEHLVVLARDPAGYARLCRAISTAQMAGTKGVPRADLEQLAALHGGHWLVLTGCRKGTVPHALTTRGPSAAAWQLDRLVDAFGRDHVAVELADHGDPLDSVRNDGLVRLAASAGVDVVAAGNVHYATPARRRLATALAAVRARRPLDELDGWLPGGAGAHLRSGLEQATAWPATRARSSGRASSAGRSPSTSSWSRPACPTSPCPRATPR